MRLSHVPTEIKKMKPQGHASAILGKGKMGE
jgi:hypothetical protein